MVTVQYSTADLRKQESAVDSQSVAPFGKACPGSTACPWFANPLNNNASCHSEVNSLTFGAMAQLGCTRKYYFTSSAAPITSSKRSTTGVLVLVYWNVVGSLVESLVVSTRQLL